MAGNGSKSFIFGPSSFIIKLLHRDSSVRRVLLSDFTKFMWENPLSHAVLVARKQDGVFFMQPHAGCVCAC